MNDHYIANALGTAREDVERARAELATAEDDRNTIILTAHSEGWSLRKIAAEAGVSFARVAQIVNQEEKP